MELLNNIFVSVIVASYNYGRYIRDNLESLHKQTYSNFEVIIVDDGSTDNSLDIIGEYIKKDSRFKLITHENNSNIGLRKSLIKAVENVKGDYIAFCESDDYWDINYLKEKVQYINKYPEADVVVSDFVVFGTAQEQIEHYTYSPGLLELYAILKKIKTPQNIFYPTRFTWTFPTFSIVMVKISCLKDCSFEFESKHGIDVPLWQQLLLHCKIGYVDKKLTYYRRSGESQIRSNNYADLNKCKQQLENALNLSKKQKIKIKLMKKLRKIFHVLNCKYYININFLFFKIHIKKSR